MCIILIPELLRVFEIFGIFEKILILILILILLLVLSTRYFLQILIITRTNGDMSHFARVGIFNWGLRMWMLTFDD